MTQRQTIVITERPREVSLVRVEPDQTIVLASQPQPFYITSDIGPPGPQGIQGPIGATGPTGATGSRGPQGDQGVQGIPGTAATVSVEQTVTGSAGSSASVLNLGTASAAQFRFTIPRGDVGQTGSRGPTGPAGAAGADGADGAKGDRGEQGPAGASTVIRGNVPDWTAPNIPSNPTAGDVWILQSPTGAPNRIYDNSAAEAGDGMIYSTSWFNGGPLRGPRGLEGPEGPAGTTKHSELTDTNLADSHPLNAITGLIDNGNGDRYLANDGTYKILSTVHNNLTDRDAADAHPIAAISQLQTTLDTKLNQTDSDGRYLQLAGGTLTGQLICANNTWPKQIIRATGTQWAGIRLESPTAVALTELAHTHGTDLNNQFRIQITSDGIIYASWIFHSSGQVDFPNSRLTNIGDATADKDALNRRTADARYVEVAGDTMTGGLSFGSATAANADDLTRHLALWGTEFGFSITSGTLNYVCPNTNFHRFRTGGANRFSISNGGADSHTNRIINVGDATADTDALNRQTADSRYLVLTGGTLTGQTVVSNNVYPQFIVRTSGSNWAAMDVRVSDTRFTRLQHTKNPDNQFRITMTDGAVNFTHWIFDVGGGLECPGTVVINPGMLHFTQRLGQHIGLWGVNDAGIGVQSSNVYFRTGTTNTTFSWFGGGTHHDNQHNAGGGQEFMRLSRNQLLLNNTGSHLNFGNRLGQHITLWNPDFGIGIQTGTQYFRVSANSAFSWHQGGSHNDGANNPGGGTERMRLDNNGIHVRDVQATSSSRWGAWANQGGTFERLCIQTSTATVKDVLGRLEASEAVAIVRQLLPVRYRSLLPSDDNTKERLGVIAEEVQQVDARLSDGRYIEWAELLAVMLATIQDLDARLSQVETR